MSEQKKRRPNSSFRSSRSGQPLSSRQTNVSQSAPNVSNVKSATEMSSAASCRSRASPNLFQNKTSRPQSGADNVRKIIQEEGRSARNLVTWSVPVEDQAKSKVKVSNSVTPSSPSHKPSQRSDRSHSGSRPASSMSSPGTQRKLQLEKNGTANKVPGKKDLRARYWAFLFENLRRAVDEIYQTCEADESVVECKEVIMMLNQCTKDFQSLIERLQVLRAYENADETNRPTSLAWEVRKFPSPGKSLSSHHVMKETIPSASVSRSLTFAAVSPQSNGPPRPSAVGNSWADRVKGVRNAFTPTPEHPIDGVPEPVFEDCAEEEGWEKVQRAGKARVRGIVPPPSDRLKSSSMNNTSDMKLPSAVPVRSEQPQSVIGIDGKRSETSETVVKQVDGVAENANRFMEASHHGTDLKSSKSSEHLSVAKEGTLPMSSPPFRYTSEPCHINQVSPEEQEDLGVPIDRLDSRNMELQRSKSETTVMCQKSYSDETLVGDAATAVAATASAGKQAKKPKSTRTLCPPGHILTHSEDDADCEDEDIDEDDDDDDDDDDDLALCEAMDEEDTLVHELEKEQEAAIESAILQEESWLQELAREQSLEIHVDTEPDTEHEEMSASGSFSGSGKFDSPFQQSLDWDTMMKQYEEESESKGLSWGDMVEEAEGRTPGRVVHVHEKLSSPSRKRSVMDTKRHQEEKQAKARELREKLLAEKAERLRMLTKKVEEVQLYKEELMNQRRLTMERRLERAEQKRQMQLQMKVRKAREEETKGNEIAFINSLEAQNKRHEILSKHQESEARLLDLQEERQRKHEEKAAKEAAVEERRRALETERQTRFQEIAERRRQRASEFEMRQQEKEKERAEAARAKERDREERLAALNKQQQAHIEELQKKIQLKQDETDRRHKEKLEAIQEKAFKMSILQHSTEDHNDVPKLVPYEKKKICIVCNVMIPSEVYLLSHLRGKKHQQAMTDSHTGHELTRQEIESFNLKHIADAPLDRPDPQSACDKERLRVLRKRCKKLRLRLSQRGAEYENTLANKPLPAIESEHKNKLSKIGKDLQKFVRTPGMASGPWPQNMVSSLDRTLGEISRILDKKVAADQIALRSCSGLVTLCSLLGIVGQSQSDPLTVAPSKSVVHVCSVLRRACFGCNENCQYLLLSSKICTVVDVLSHHIAMMIPDTNSGSSVQTSGNTVVRLPYSPTANALMELLTAVFTTLASQENDKKHNGVTVAGVDILTSQASDIVSYVVSLGILDKLSQFLSNIRGPIDNDNLQTIDFLQNAMDLLTAVICLTARRSGYIFEKKKADDPTQLTATLKATQLTGVVSLMYGMLLHTDAPARGDNPPPTLAPHTVSIVRAAFKMLNNIASLNLSLLQSVLGEEGTSLEFRHIGSYLLWYCHHHTEEELLHELILCIGYFCVLNHDNQMIIQSGQPPTVLQQLCSLPFPYFSDIRLTLVLFPTLVSCCFQVERNREILEQELSCALLANFLEEKILEGPRTKKTKQVTDKDIDSRMVLSARFPVDSWQAAQTYFSTN